MGGMIASFVFCLSALIPCEISRETNRVKYVTAKDAIKITNREKQAGIKITLFFLHFFVVDIFHSIIAFGVMCQ